MRAATIVALVGSVACTRPTPVPTETIPGPSLAPARTPQPAGGGPSNDDAPARPQYEPCVAQMFDHPPGYHHRHVFERTDGVMGFKDDAGVVVIAARFRFAYEFSPGGVAGVVDADGFAFIDPDGRVIARAFASDNGPDYFTEDRARIVADDKVGFIDGRGTLVVPAAYDHAMSFCEGRAAVCNGCTPVQTGEHTEMVGGRWGYIDRDGREVVPLRYDAAEMFHDGRATVVDGGVRRIIDRDGGSVDAP